jgi:hypothetical protein
MSGYTPVFSTIYSGTLYGQWPAAPVWASLLPLCDKHGIIRFSWAALCGMTGWPEKLLREGIAQLMRPDPGSQSHDHDGRRLIPHEHRDGKDWGWIAVNHGKYREKARKSASEMERIASGENAERMRARRAATRDDPPRPAMTRDDRPSDADADTDLNPKNKDKHRLRGSRLPDGWQPDPGGIAYCQSLGLDPAIVRVEFTEFWHAKAGPNATKLRWDLTWRTWCRRARADRRAPLAKPQKTHAEVVAEIAKHHEENARKSGFTLPNLRADR